MKTVTASFACVCLVTLLGLTVWQSGAFNAAPLVSVNDSTVIGEKDFIEPDRQSDDIVVTTIATDGVQYTKRQTEPTAQETEGTAAQQTSVTTASRGTQVTQVPPTALQTTHSRSATAAQTLSTTAATQDDHAVGDVAATTVVATTTCVVDDEDEELWIERFYDYRIADGPFSAYHHGKVIAVDKVGDKVADVTVMAGWKATNGVWLSEEQLRAEVYAINGVTDEVAIALRFVDKGEAVTTTHYYVMLNPDADLTAIADYVIALPTLDDNTEIGSGVLE